MIDLDRYPQYGIDPNGNNRRLIFHLDREDKAGRLSDEDSELLADLRRWQDQIDN